MVNNIKIANETLKICKDGGYEVGGKKIVLPKEDITRVEVITPEAGRQLLEEDISGLFGESMCGIEVTCEDSFAAAKRLKEPLVMNFANAHNTGGGFRWGASAQEEALCRRSTLYPSISCDTAKEMYRYNNTHPSKTESDYMLYSPDVWVFRDEGAQLTDQPFKVSVMTVPAPNRYGAAMLASTEAVNETILRRIRIMLRAAAKRGIKDLVLGAWGCGAFGNAPTDVAAQFGTALTDDGLGRCFERVVFAIYGKPDGRNITAFKEHFLK